MKCPYCNIEMEKGYIQCRDGVTWTPKKQLLSSLSVLGKNSIQIANGASDDYKTVYAYNCHECKKIVIEYLPL